MEAFFFGRGKFPLFGAYYPARSGLAHRSFALICPPIGQEYIRSFQAITHLCTHLSSIGISTFRFDLRGNGDSFGESEDWDFSGWVDDLETAIEEFKQIAGENEVKIIGLRVGAQIAAAYLNNQPLKGRFCLWHPVLTGKAYLDEISRGHHAFMAENALKSIPSRGSCEVLGFRLKNRLKEELADLHLDARKPQSSEWSILGGARDASTRRFAWERGLGWMEGDGNPFWEKSKSVSSLVPLGEIQRLGVWASAP